MTRFAVLALWSVIGASSLLLTGCGDRDDDVRYRRVERGHVCGVDCHEHYYDGRKTVIVSGHRHGPGCGHHWDGRRWVVVRSQPKPPQGHQCTIDCHHHAYSSYGHEISLRNHRHGPGCGHVYNGHRWVAASGTPRGAAGRVQRERVTQYDSRSRSGGRSVERTRSRDGSVEVERSRSRERSRNSSATPRQR